MESGRRNARARSTPESASPTRPSASHTLESDSWLTSAKAGRTSSLIESDCSSSAFCRDEIAALERHSPLRANGVDHRRMRGQSYRFGTVERLFREVLGLGQQTFDARNPGERAGQCDLLQAWCGDADPRFARRSRVRRGDRRATAGCAREGWARTERPRRRGGPSVRDDRTSARSTSAASPYCTPTRARAITSRARSASPKSPARLLARMIHGAAWPAGALAANASARSARRPGSPACGLRSYLGSKAMQHTTVALDEGVDEAASEQLECCCFLTCDQEVTERILDVAGIDEEGGGASMEGLLAVRIVGVESVPQQVSEQMVVPVGVSGQLDEEEVPVVDAAEQTRRRRVVGSRPRNSPGRARRGSKSRAGSRGSQRVGVRGPPFRGSR